MVGGQTSADRCDRESDNRCVRTGMNKIITDLTHENQPEHVKTRLVMNDSNLTLMNESLFGAGYTDTSDDSDTS